jgi:stalled ribosome alternative rescue factor ArfA
MRKNLIVTLLFFLFINPPFSFSQEWRNLKYYQKTTGQKVLGNGSWLKKDRKRNTETWQQANTYNLTIAAGNLKYKTISQIRDFYLWFDTEREKLGHEINAVGVAAVVAEQLSNFDNYFIRTFIVRNKEVVWFGNEGSKKVLAFAFPLLKEIYFLKNKLKGQEAKKWDIKTGKIEQCQIIEVIYTQLSSKAIRKLERMAKGKGIYSLAVKNKLTFEGDIRDCKSRYEHAFSKLISYYLDTKRTKL